MNWRSLHTVPMGTVPFYITNCRYTHSGLQVTWLMTLLTIQNVLRHHHALLSTVHLNSYLPSIANIIWGIGTVLASSINGHHVLFPPSPVTAQYAALLSSNWKDQFCGYPKPASEEWGWQCTNVYTVATQTVELVLLNYASPAPLVATQPHPAHLHGHHFQVVKIGYAKCSDGNCMNSDIVCDRKYCDGSVNWAKGCPFNVSKVRLPLKIQSLQVDMLFFVLKETIQVGGFFTVKLSHTN